MEETAQLTSALKYLPWGKEVPIFTDARFSCTPGPPTPRSGRTYPRRPDDTRLWAALQRAAAAGCIYRPHRRGHRLRALKLSGRM